MIAAKTEEEIALLREPCRIVRDCLAFVEERIRAGMTTKDVDEMVYKFITGAEPLSNFDEYLETLERMNFQRAIEITQQAYDRYMAQ